MSGYWKRTKRVSGESQTRTRWWCVPGVWLIVHCNGGRGKCSEHAHIPNHLPLFSLTFLTWGWGLGIPEAGQLSWPSGTGRGWDEPFLRRENLWVRCSVVRRGMPTEKKSVGQREALSVCIERRIVRIVRGVASSGIVVGARWGGSREDGSENFIPKRKMSASSRTGLSHSFIVSISFVVHALFYRRPTAPHSPWKFAFIHPFSPRIGPKSTD